MDRCVSHFISTVLQDKTSLPTVNLYSKLIQQTQTNGLAIFKLIKETPSLLVKKIDTEHFVFDYFFDYTIHGCMHPVYESIWYETLYSFIEMLEDLGEWGIVLKKSKYYLLQCQKDSRNHFQLFECLYNNDFEVEPLEDLVYSIVARGETDKLALLGEHYEFDELNKIIAIALHYGRIEVLHYLIEERDISMVEYGDILRFEGLDDDKCLRYMFYIQSICNENACKDVLRYGPVQNTKQDYLASLQLIMETLSYPVDVSLIDIWCSFMQKKIFEWDVVPIEVLVYLKSQLNEPIPLDHDFGPYTKQLLGNNWGDRASLVQQCLYLQQKLNRAEERFEMIYYKYHALLSEHRALRKVRPMVKLRRKRCVTE